MSDLIPKIEKKQLRYDFTAVEIHDLSLRLAHETKKLTAVEEEKKTIQSQYKAKVDEVKASTNTLSNLVSDGWEMREVECEVEFHKPRQGMKSLTRKDTGEVIEEKMTEWEWNLFNQVDDKETSDLLDKEREKLRGN